MRPILPLLSIVALGLLAACGPREAPKPPEKVVNVTTAAVLQKDLPLTESAVGSATSLGFAQALDPTRLQRNTFSIRLPFPEHVARRLHIGQGVRLTSFDDPNKTETATIREIRPALDSTTQTMEVIAELPGGQAWYSVGSVRGEVTIGMRRGALVVPEQAVVLRPAGTVVYVTEGELARERTVTTGVLRDGAIEIVTGLKPGETVVVDGAALLSDGARIRAMNATTTGTGAKP